MNVLQNYLEERDESPQFPALNAAAEVRLTKFDAWLYDKLASLIDWTWAGDETAKVRRINQARNYVERLVIALWRRGWLLDGKTLARHIVAPLQCIADYQKKGTIKNFWPYFCATIDRYVGVNSEEIQVETQRIGSSIGQITGLLGLKDAPKERALPELIAQRAQEVAKAHESTLREKQAALRRNAAVAAEDDRQISLFDA